MERKILVHIEKLPEGFYLATSNDLQGSVAQGRTISETLEIASDVAKKPLEAQHPEDPPTLAAFDDSFDYPPVVGL